MCGEDQMGRIIYAVVLLLPISMRDQRESQPDLMAGR